VRRGGPCTAALAWFAPVAQASLNIPLRGMS